MLMLSLLVALHATDAQPRQNTPVIGVISNVDLKPRLANPSSFIYTFPQGLRDMGYVEGQNIRIEYRPFGETLGRRSLQEIQAQLSAFAAELVRLPVDALVTFGAHPTLAAREATTTIPIVFACTYDPVAQGLVKSLAQPGGNITGAAGTTLDLIGKQLELIKEIVPGARRVATLVDPTDPLLEASMIPVEAMARSLGLELHPLKVSDPANELERAFASLVHERIDAIRIVGYPSFFPYREQIVALAAKSQVPAIYNNTHYVTAGGLMAYEPDCQALARSAGTLVGKILQGAKPAELPVEQPLKHNLVINLKTAKALGITIPPSVLMLADEVIQ
jgi:putative ABC transport system substrate-binding protein